MSVESFSQLPFIRHSKSSSGGAIRLFGKDDDHVTRLTTTNGRDGEPTNGDHHQVSIDNNNNNNNNTDADNNNNNKNNIITSSTRKFECHYCCRNFPTSQALGGHQNAHKRERQHAKRAHLQSPMVHDYGQLMAFSNRPIGYQYPGHSWNSHTRQLYAGNSIGHQLAHPINGCPFATWRIPTAHSSSAFERGSLFMQQHSQIINSHTLSFDSKGGRDLMINMPVSGGAGLGSQGSKGSMKDHVSLDLHL